MEFLDERCLQELVYGGAVLGAGGGGSIEAGLDEGCQALAEGAPRMVRIEELSPKARIATLSVVGSVFRMTGGRPQPQHGAALRRLVKLDKRPVAAIVSSEVGPQAVIYGWRESAATSIPIVDAPLQRPRPSARPDGLAGASSPSPVHHKHSSSRRKRRSSNPSGTRPPGASDRSQRDGAAGCG